jgi:hypothetical protein
MLLTQPYLQVSWLADQALSQGWGHQHIHSYQYLLSGAFGHSGYFLYLRLLMYQSGGEGSRAASFGAGGEEYAGAGWAE